MSKILVIDDEAWLREMIRLALEQQGFEVIEATDSPEGIDAGARRTARPHPLRCQHGQGGAGYITLAELREDATTAAIPFILMTGLADTAGMRHGMELGADDYLPKPFKVEELYAAVKARLRKVQTVRDEAERKLAALRSQFRLMLPHEMRTPLNGIISNAELLATVRRHARPPRPSPRWARKSAIRPAARTADRKLSDLRPAGNCRRRPAKHHRACARPEPASRRSSSAPPPPRRRKRPGA